MEGSANGVNTASAARNVVGELKYEQENATAPNLPTVGSHVRENFKRLATVTLKNALWMGSSLSGVPMTRARLVVEEEPKLVPGPVSILNMVGRNVWVKPLRRDHATLMSAQVCVVCSLM